MLTAAPPGPGWDSCAAFARGRVPLRPAPRRLSLRSKGIWFGFDHPSRSGTRNRFRPSSAVKGSQLEASSHWACRSYGQVAGRSFAASPLPAKREGGNRAQRHRGDAAERRHVEQCLRAGGIRALATPRAAFGRRTDRYGRADGCGRSAALTTRATLAARCPLGRTGAPDRPRLDESRRGRAPAGARTALARGAAPAAGAAVGTRAACGQRVGSPDRCAQARLGAGRRGEPTRWSRLCADPDRRPAHSLGFLLFPRHPFLQLAARASAVRGARLRRCARALSPSRPEPLEELLDACRAVASRLARPARVVAGVRTRTAGVSSRSLRGSRESPGCCGERTLAHATGLRCATGSGRRRLRFPCAPIPAGRNSLASDEVLVRHWNGGSGLFMRWS
jgi:hypothetical protein